MRKSLCTGSTPEALFYLWAVSAAIYAAPSAKTMKFLWLKMVGYQLWRRPQSSWPPKRRSLSPHGNIGVAYTYNEPLIGYEYVRDCAALVHEQGMVNVLVTNGTVEEEPWRALLPLVDAANIDLKGFTPA